MPASIETVHLVFKTHFDFGFTDFASAVAAQYFDVFIPQVLTTAEAMRNDGGEERYVWTTGAWLIYEYLERAAPPERRRMEAAIEAGDIAWHGLPFTLHTELADPGLFRFGLCLSKALDRRFGRRTIAGKMTDVPGHTRAMVPLLAEAGLGFLHLGVNEAATPPDVPPVFVWRSDGGEEVIVMYQHAYGGMQTVPGLSEALAFGFTDDNLGPQPPDRIRAIFREVREAFPGATVRASTLDAFAEALLAVKDRLPVVTAEVGDTWIQGVGTDPRKVSRYRALCLLRRRWLETGRIQPESAVIEDFSRSLLCVPEHTWGLDEKTHLGDYTHYERPAFDAARDRPAFRKMEASWAEQRAYVDRAVEALHGTPLFEEAQDCLRTLEPAPPDLQGYERVATPAGPFESGHFTIGFDPSTGTVAHLVHRTTGRAWAAPEHPLAWFRYQTFSGADYDRYLRQYLARTPDWAVPDNAKPGIEKTYAESRWWDPELAALWCREDEDALRFVAELVLPARCTTHYGGPRRVTMALELPHDEPELRFTLQWFGKPACRLPEALWCSFSPAGTVPEGWLMDKMGRPVSPLDVVPNGNRKLHAVGRGFSYHDAAGSFALETPDAPLVAPGAPSLLDFNNTLPPLEHGMHVNLYNNVWGTNFPMWYDDDARFRFTLRIPSVARDPQR